MRLSLAVFPLLVATALAQAPSPNFQYNILSVTSTRPGQKPVVRFSVTNPVAGNAPYNLATDPAWTATGVSRLALQIAYPSVEYTNVSSGTPPSLPMTLNLLTGATANGDGTYTATSPTAIPTTVTGSGAVAIEGRAAAQDAIGAYTVHVRIVSAIRYFTITDSTPLAHRQPADINKCLVCHGTLSTHGDNRTNNLRVCEMCHNANDTDITQRLFGDGPETPIDFKTMIHSIHAGGFRRTPFIVIGFGHSVNDFSTVRFPAQLRQCLNCHVSTASVSLPIASVALPTTTNTASTLTTTTKVVDADPSNNLRTTKTAAVCSACHDDSETRSHMIRTGNALFNAPTATAMARQELCVNCHGPGKREDVIRVHELNDR